MSHTTHLKCTTTKENCYLQWQAWLQQTQPKLLVLRGKHDLSFELGESQRYRKDVPNAEVSVLDEGVAYFQHQGFEVVHASHLTPAITIPHPNLGADVNPANCTTGYASMHRPIWKGCSSPGTDCARSG